MTKISAWKIVSLFLLLCSVTTIGSSAQVFADLVDFDQTNGAAPRPILGRFSNT
jgi:hypothetical protein